MWDMIKHLVPPRTAREQREYVLSHGWCEAVVKDNWVKTRWIEDGRRYEHMGQPLEHAYKQAVCDAFLQEARARETEKPGP